MEFNALDLVALIVLLVTAATEVISIVEQMSTDSIRSQTHRKGTFHYTVRVILVAATLHWAFVIANNM